MSGYPKYSQQKFKENKMKRIFYATILIVISFMTVKCQKEVTTSPKTETLTIEESQPVTDIDGNTYQTIKIGNQIWMAENLKTQHYSDGTPIESYAYNNDTTNVRTYGRLYGWAESMRSAKSSNSIPSGVQGASPAGWHIPSNAEWQVLIDNLGGEAIAGGKLKEAGTSHWTSSNAGATNESKFTLLPAGWFDFTGEFRRIGEWVFMRTSTSPGSYSVYARVFKSNLTSASSGDLHPDDAIPIRCVKD
jgi:uncharacterized protein (TIGR02145 family)